MHPQIMLQNVLNYNKTMEINISTILPVYLLINFQFLHFYIELYIHTLIMQEQNENSELNK